MNKETKLPPGIEDFNEVKTFLKEDLEKLNQIIIFYPSDELLQARIRVKESIYWIEEHIIKYQK